MSGALVEVTRGGTVESVHFGSVVVGDADGTVLFAWGDPDLAVFPRSAVKAIQAIPLVESGAADRYGFEDRDLALACASHSGEPDHLRTARDLLSRAELDEKALECGAHWSLRQPVLIEQARGLAHGPTPVCNNCSGKHAGFLCTAVHHGFSTEGYVHPDHPVQETVRRVLEEVTGVPHDSRNRAIDGCSIPTYAVPLRALASAFARLETGTLPPERAKAAARIMTACRREPFMVAGTDRFDTAIMKEDGIFAKTGAEGVYCGSIAGSPYGIALKIADGASRASEVAFAAVCAALSDDAKAHEFARVPLNNWRGTQVGELRPAPDFHRRLLAAAAGSV